MLLFRIPADNIGIKKPTEGRNSEAIRSLCDAALAKEMKIVANILTALNLVCYLSGERMGANGKVSRQRWLQSAA